MSEPRSERINDVTQSIALHLQSHADDSRVVAAMQEYLRAMEQGEAPSRESFLAKHADIATGLADCLDGLALVYAAAHDMEKFTSVTGGEANAEMLKQPLGDFRLVKEIGRGGMGIVYEAIQLSLGRRVAVKVLPLAAAFEPKHLQRFKNEAQSAAQLHHTNIVPIYGVGAERGIHYYAMQLIEGYSLANLIEERRLITPLANPTKQLPVTLRYTAANRAAELENQPPETVVMQQVETKPLAPASAQRSTSNLQLLSYFREVVEFVRQAAVAMEYAHSFGVVHRDIKPANLLIDQRNNLWITDFGLAMIRSDVQMTHTGDVLGTLRYMSPEQAAGERAILDHRTDIYSLGATLYELLTLEPLISGDDTKTLLRRILLEEPRTPRTLEKRIPLELETIVLKAIAKTPSERYATAQQMADDLQRWMDDKPIQARRPTLLEQAARWSRRNQPWVRAGIVLLCLTTFGLLLSTIFIAREHGRTKVAYQNEMKARKDAENSFRQARTVVDAFTQLSEEELAHKPMLYQLRRKFLATSLGYYQNFLQQRKDDPTVREELTATSQWISQIVEELSLMENSAPYFLLAEDRLRKELALSESQTKQVDQLLEQPLFNLSQSQPGKNSKLLAVDQLRGFEEKMRNIITQPQTIRLKQIALQQRGPFVFKSPEIIAALQLTTEQRTRIQQIIEENRPKKREPGMKGPGEGPPHKDSFDFGGPPPGRDKSFSEFDDFGPPHKSDHEHDRDEHRPPPHEFGFREGRDRFGKRSGGPGPQSGEMWENMKRTVARIREILNAEQLAIWNNLVGEPFDVDLGWRPDDLFPQ